MAEGHQVLHLWLTAAALDSEVIAWAHYRRGDDTSGPGERPYRTGVEAIDDGWWLVQAPGPIGPDDTDGELGCEFVFQRRLP